MRNASQRLVRALLLLGFASLATAGMGLQHRMIRLESDGGNPYQLLFLPSKSYVKHAALGYDHSLADFLFLRAIQAFGATYAHSIDLSSLWSYFDTITDLDPHFLSPYSFGNLVLGETAGDREKGLAILDKGIGNNPEHYKPAYDAAFYSFWGLSRPELARNYVGKALTAPDCPDFVRRWVAFLDEKMGRYEAAYQNFLGEYLRAVNGGDATLQGIQNRRLRYSIDQWCLQTLREKAIGFHDREGRYPSVAELENSGAFHDVEWPDWPRLQSFLAAVEEGSIKADDSPEAVEKLAAGFLHRGWDRMPPSPMSHNPNFTGYVIWPTHGPDLPDGTPNRNFVKNEFDAAYMLSEYLRISDDIVRRYREKHDGACPPDLATAFPAPENVSDPFGGRFTYDPLRCQVNVTSVPDVRESVGNDRPMQ